tara:strand:+ start:3027 stop:3290 length:264 start_codon:yes stop_codon:yes gene_type:complete
MSIESKQNISTMVQFLQLLVLIFGVAGVFTHIGSRDNQLATNTKEIQDIKGIAQDLLQTQITSTSNDARLFEALDALKTRVMLLERK